MPVLVDFAHGKPVFTIHTDHHDSQSGVEDETSTQFRGARSNVETISQVVSPYDIFTSAMNSGIYADSSVYDPETGAMTKDNSLLDQARVDGFWQQISEIIPDAGRPVINNAIDEASADVI